MDLRPPASSSLPIESLLAGYAPRRNVYDEMVDPAGRVRPHWRELVEGFAALGADGLAAAAEATRRHLRDSGIAFNVYADPDDPAHAWRLDLVPVLIPEAEWAGLARGLAQRARLIDRALSDLYGPRNLVLDGTLPAALVFGADAFIRSEVGVSQKAVTHLTTYACDIARTADGRWVVLGDQTDAPIGNGYVIASRVALSHGLAQLFTACNTRRLAGHYMQVQATLQSACRRDDGRIAVLAPGPESPCYFSHAYLARYLGYTLVESADLTVRDTHLYVKTLDGLQRVDALLRKVPGADLDPLLLPGRGLAGVPGLMQIVRAGGVVVGNALGSGLAQNRALTPWLPELCRRLLGEELLLADHEALWLGDRASLRLVATTPDAFQLARLRARNDPGSPVVPIELARLNAADRRKLFDRLERDGHGFAAQRPVTLATTPSYDGTGFVPTPYAVRCFLAWNGEDFAVLPGGLVRLAGAPGSTALPNGFGSKDLWVTADKPEPQAKSILKTNLREIHLHRAGRDLLSRTADNLFWLGRYAERAEGTMRLVRSVLARLLEDGRADADPLVLRRLLTMMLLKATVSTADGTAVAAPRGTLQELAATLMFETRAYGLRESLDHLHRTATLVRGQISHDAWRMLNALHVDRRWREVVAHTPTSATLELLDDGVRALNAFSGTEAENMTRNFAWQFLEMGRRLERAVRLVELTQELALEGGGTEQTGTDPTLHLLLELGDSFMTYRSRYMITPLAAPALDLLILDETNPRGIAFQLCELEAHLGLLPNNGSLRTDEQRLALKLSTALRLGDASELAEPDPSGRRVALASLLEELATGLPQLSDLIVGNHFAHAETPVMMLAMRRTATGAGTP